jgi:hypothetical protein
MAMMSDQMNLQVLGLSRKNGIQRAHKVDQTVDLAVEVGLRGGLVRAEAPALIRNINKGQLRCLLCS